jgi:hypothetical protein
MKKKKNDKWYNILWGDITGNNTSNMTIFVAYRNINMAWAGKLIELSSMSLAFKILTYCVNIVQVRDIQNQPFLQN